MLIFFYYLRLEITDLKLTRAEVLKIALHASLMQCSY